MRHQTYLLNPQTAEGHLDQLEVLDVFMLKVGLELYFPEWDTARE